MEEKQKKGGKRLDALQEIQETILDKANTFSKKKIELEKMKNDYNKMRLPKDGRNQDEKKSIMRNRADARKRIKLLESQVLKLSKESKELVIPEEREKLTNLARNVNYPIKDFKEMDVIELQRHKKNLFYKAAQTYKSKSAVATEGIITVASAFEMVPACKGCSKSLRDSKEDIKDSVNQVFIDLGMNDVKVGQYINPYTALLLTVAAPIIGTVLINMNKPKKVVKVDKVDKKKSKENLKKKS
jgi:hypothetical protein